MSHESADILKKALRAEIAARNSRISKDYRQMADANIQMHFLNLPMYRDSDTIFCYVSTASEPSTDHIIEQAWKAGKTVCVPRCISKGKMEVKPIKGWDDLSPGKFGIWEPTEHLPNVLESTIDLVIVPCVSAYYDGSRLGHGGGYYDRFLQRSNAAKLCLCYEQLMTDSIPMVEYDVRMDAVISENGIYTGQ